MRHVQRIAHHHLISHGCAQNASQRLFCGLGIFLFQCGLRVRQTVYRLVDIERHMDMNHSGVGFVDFLAFPAVRI